MFSTYSKLKGHPEKFVIEPEPPTSPSQSQKPVTEVVGPNVRAAVREEIMLLAKEGIFSPSFQSQLVPNIVPKTESEPPSGKTVCHLL